MSLNKACLIGNLGTNIMPEFNENEILVCNDCGFSEETQEWWVIMDYDYCGDCNGDNTILVDGGIE